MVDLNSSTMSDECVNAARSLLLREVESLDYRRMPLTENRSPPSHAHSS